MFFTAVEEHFDVQTNSKSTLIDVPWGAPIFIVTRKEGNYPIKIKGETETRQAFFDHFYQAVQKELSRKA